MSLKLDGGPGVKVEIGGQTVLDAVEVREGEVVLRHGGRLMRAMMTSLKTEIDRGSPIYSMGRDAPVGFSGGGVMRLTIEAEVVEQLADPIRGERIDMVVIDDVVEPPPDLTTRAEVEQSVDEAEREVDALPTRGEG